MNQMPQLALIVSVGIPFLFFLGNLSLRWGVHRKIRATFEKNGTSVNRIQRFRGFLDLGSISKALTSAGYVATITAPDGKMSDVFCLVRYIPIVGFVRSVEIWSERV